MQKRGDLKDLDLFLDDLKLDGIILKDLPCDSKTHTKEHCKICKFFNGCPFPKREN